MMDKEKKRIRGYQITIAVLLIAVFVLLVINFNNHKPKGAAKEDSAAVEGKLKELPIVKSFVGEEDIKPEISVLENVEALKKEAPVIYENAEDGMTLAKFVNGNQALLIIYDPEEDALVNNFFMSNAELK